MTNEQSEPIVVEPPELVPMSAEQEAEAVAALVRLLLPYAARLVEQRRAQPNTDSRAETS